MDEVVEKLGALGESEEKKSNFEALYKNWGRPGSQDQRRKELLNLQKSHRTRKLDQCRGILDLVNAVEEGNLWKRDTPQTNYRPNIYVAGFNKASYNNVLMMSEWIIEKPEDFEENWYAIPCPKGVRSLVVACNGSTKVYSKYGQFLFECKTKLPGGNPRSRKPRVEYCILDAFYVKKTNMLYVLDMLAWVHQPVTDCDAEFRNYWLTTKFDETPELQAIGPNNEIVFKILTKTPCTKDSFNTFMSTYPAFEGNYPELDGLLFLHKKGYYTSGETPLMGWLYPYMVTEIFGEDVAVHESFQKKPEGYTNQQEFIVKFDNKYKQRRYKIWKERIKRIEDQIPVPESMDYMDAYDFHSATGIGPWGKLDNKTEEELDKARELAKQMLEKRMARLSNPVPEENTEAADAPDSMEAETIEEKNEDGEKKDNGDAEKKDIGDAEKKETLEEPAAIEDASMTTSPVPAKKGGRKSRSRK